MLADPAASAHPDRRQLAALQPDPGAPSAALPRQVQLSEQIDHHLLEIAQIAVQVGFMALQVQDRIEHQLAGGVVGHLTAAVDAVEGQGRIGRIEAQVGRTRATPQGVTGFMLQQQHRLRSLGISQ